MRLELLTTSRSSLRVWKTGNYCSVHWFFFLTGDNDSFTKMQYLLLYSFFFEVLINILISLLFSRKRKMSGFGHRVYKNYDPRAKVIRKLADEVFSIVGRDPLIEVFFYSMLYFSLADRMCPLLFVHGQYIIPATSQFWY